MTKTRSRFLRGSRMPAARPHFQSLEPRRLLSATVAQIGDALDLDPAITVTYTGHDDAVGVYENYTVEGLLGMPSGPDGDFLVISTAHAFDAVRTTDVATKANTDGYRDLGVAGAADDFAEITFTISVPAAVYNLRFMIDFIYASDMGTDGGDFFDIIVDGVNIADTFGGRVEAGGQYVTNERDPDLSETLAGYGLQINTEYSDLLTATYTVPGADTELNVTIRIADSNDAEFDAWAIIDNIRFEETQVVFLDFDGQDIGDFYLSDSSYTISAFDANDFGLGGDFADVIKADLEGMFVDFDIVFVTNEPSSGDFMRVVIGGENRDEIALADTEANAWLFNELGETPTFREVFNYMNFRNANGTEASYGLSDRLDLSNDNPNDTAVVFAKQISRDGLDFDALKKTIAHHIGRNLGLRAENNGATGSIMAEDILLRGTAFQDEGHAYHNDSWGDLEALGVTQNTYQRLLDNLGAAGGETAIRNSWTDAVSLNQAHWTVGLPRGNDLFDARFVIIGDKHTRTVTTDSARWEDEQILITDFAGQDPQIVISAASRSGGRHNYTTDGPRSLGQFTAVIDDAIITILSLWDIQGNTGWFQGQTTLFQTQAADTTVYYSQYKYTEADGDDVTIKLKTGSGLFTVSDTDHGVVITLAETDGQRDTLTISVRQKDGGDGRAMIGGIIGTGLKTLNGNKADYSGTGINLTRLKTGKFGALMDGTDFNIRQNEGDTGNFKFTTINGDSRLIAGRTTKKIEADSITAGSMAFDDLRKLASKTDLNLARLDVFDGHLGKVDVKGNLTGGDWFFHDDTADNSLKTFLVKGNVSGLSMTADRRIFTINVKGDLDATINAAAISKLDVKGDWSGAMQLDDDGTLYSQSARKLNIKGSATNVLFQTLNDVAEIKLGAAIDSNFYVGWDLSITSGIPIDSGLLVNDTAKIKNVKIVGVNGLTYDMEGTVFSATSFKSLKLGDINGDNLGVPFGISAFTIDKIEFDTGTGKVNNKNDDSFNDNDNGDDFLIGRIV